MEQLNITNSLTTWVPHFKLSQFSIVSQIGHGGEGAVYLANNDHFGDVALKRLDRNTDLNGNSGEADLLVKIKHPHIVQIFGIIIEEHGTPMCSGFIMEYMKLGSLHSVIHSAEIRYGLKQAFSWIIQICRGLQYLHDQNIIHRDVKSKNILLNSMDTAKLADFGFAKEVKTGSITYCVGTASYMAPEVIKDDNNRRYTQPADIYSLTITIWEIIHRKAPFYELEDASFMTIALKVLNGGRPIIDMGEVDLDLTELLQNGWHQDPSQRVSLMEIRSFATRRYETAVEEIPPPEIVPVDSQALLEQISVVSNKAIMRMERNLKTLLNLQMKEIENLRLTTEKMRKEWEWFGDNPQTILIMGGNKDEFTGSGGELLLLNKGRTEWQKVAMKLPFENEHGGSVLLNEEIYIFGGNTLVNKMYKLDENMEWIQMESMNHNRIWMINSSLVFDGCIWVLGGFDGFQKLSSVEKYCPKSNKWILMPPMNEQRAAAAAVVCNGKIFVSGGDAGASSIRLKSVECFDPAIGIWSPFIDIPSPRNGHAMVSDGKNLTIFGGWDGNVDFSDVWQINPGEKDAKWNELNPLQHPSRQFPAIQMNNMIMVIGGYCNKSNGLRRAEIFDGKNWTNGAELPGDGYYTSSAFLIPVHLAVSLLQIK